MRSYASDTRTSADPAGGAAVTLKQVPQPPEGGDNACSRTAAHARPAGAPQGSVDAGGNTFFNVGYAFHADERVDDLRFVRELVARLVADLRLDPRAVFATGMSNGGDISYLLATQRDPLVRAIAPVAGTMMTSWARDVALPEPFPVLAVHGRCDGITRWEGDAENRDGWGAYLSVDAVRARWVDALGPATEQAEPRPDRTPPRGSREHRGSSSGRWPWMVVHRGFLWVAP